MKRTNENCHDTLFPEKRHQSNSNSTSKTPSEHVPAPVAQLPIANYKEEILELIRKNVVSIIIGETGSGKSTKIPQYIVDDLKLQQLLTTSFVNTQNTNASLLKVCITQPRRLAAVAMARRVAQERNCVLGKQVGYSIRFDDCSSTNETFIKYVTDGIALREIIATGGFSAYQVFIVDEAHERSLNTDVLFSLIKKAIQYKENDLQPSIRFVITSATLDSHKFYTFFDNAPVLNIPGRSFPVEIIYAPSHLSSKISDKSTVSTSSLVTTAVNVALSLHIRTVDEGGGHGHILVFLTGKAECDAACNLLREALENLLNESKRKKKQLCVPNAIIIPLYANLSPEDQALVFEPTHEDCRKIIFSTNVAETSVTVEAVEFVVDMGLVKQKFSNTKTGAGFLSIVNISQSQAMQRAGRAGRSCPGKCFRIYTQEQFNAFLTTPILDIHRANLGSVVLQLKSLGLHDVLRIDFIDCPTKEALLLSLKHLFYLGALCTDGNLTDIGRMMVYLPLDPIYARCLIESVHYNVLNPVIYITSMLSVDNVWMHTSFHEKQETGHSNSHTSFNNFKKSLYEFYDETGDHLTLYNILSIFKKKKINERASWCRRHFLVYRALSQADNISQQLCRLMAYDALSKSFETENFQTKESYPTKNRILLSLCSGFFVNLARLASNNLVSSKNTFLQMKHSFEKPCENLWVTLRDGQLARYEPMVKGAPDFTLYNDNELVIFNDKINYTRSPKTTCGFTIGSIRIASRVQHEWVERFIKRYSELDIRRLAQSRDKTARTLYEKKDFKSSISTPFKAHDSTVSLLKDIKEAEKEKENKVSAAREKYLSRRKSLYTHQNEMRTA